jgi:hypothetical protein
MTKRPDVKIVSDADNVGRVLSKMLKHVNRPLEFDIRYKGKLHARRGQMITHGLIAELFKFDKELIEFVIPEQDPEKAWQFLELMVQKEKEEDEFL